MPRVVYKKFYDHDDRASGSSSTIRKVSFKNGGGRVKKNRRPEPLIKQFIDDDVEMDSRERKIWKGKNKPRKNFKGRPGSPGIRHQAGLPLVPLRANDWYQVRIAYGAKYEKNTLLQRILNYISPNVFIPNSYSISGNDVFFYVDDFEIAKILRNTSRKIPLEDGHLMIIKVREGHPPAINVDAGLKEKIKLVMAKRYMPDKKALDLSRFASDSDFLGVIHCPPSRPAIMKVIWQIITENIPDLVAINLSNNKISVLDESSSLEIKKLKNLKIIHLGENQIKGLHVLNCFKDLELTELVLKKNPLIKFFKDNAHYVRYGRQVTSQFQRREFSSTDSNSVDLFHSEVRRKFPKLTKLDDIELPPVILFDVADEPKLPVPQAAFMCNPQGRGIVKAFLSQYFALYDSDNRLDLAQAYHDTSSFSLCVFYPPNQKTNINRLNNYFQDNRNLFRVQDYPRRKSRLYMGKQNIVQFLTRLPKTNHDLSSFAVDLTLFTPMLINLSVSGVFREPSDSTTASSWPVRHFTRTFLIVPVGQGFCIINDLLLVTNATESEIQNSFREETQNSTILQSSPSVGGQSSGSAIKAPSMCSIQLDDSVRLQMVQTLATRTGMNLAWSKKCLDETQWDFDRAIWTFSELQSKGSIPTEAFVK